MKTYCIGCKNIECPNYGKEISFTWECNNKKDMTNVYKLLGCRSIQEMSNLITEAIQHVSESDTNDTKEAVEEWLRK